MGDTLRAVEPDWVVVQGDTTTAFVAALAAFYARIPVAHVEAGLRTDDSANPFPEEVNRRFIAQLAALHFAPTRRAHDNLVREGVRPERIFVTGNTGIDALLEIAKRERPLPASVARARANGWRVLLVTAHRRESFGDPLERICAALRSIVERNGDVCVVYPVHPNPNVTVPVRRLLADVERIFLVDATDYETFVELMKAADLILTDSGGIQEEAPSLDKPVLVLRAVTERMEAVAAGAALVVGTDPAQIVGTAEWLLRDDAAYRRMTGVANPYGDGHAAERIVAVITAPPVP
jgi:UDP-N-acetylglucosamine 2-epimerase (non-hydrolysing)